MASGAYEGPYSFSSRFENGKGTNPEELIGAAHAGCFSMALSGVLGGAGFNPESIETRAEVNLEKVESGFAIKSIKLITKGTVADIDDNTFKKHAEEAKKNCPVSQALAGVDISVEASLN